MRNYRTYLVLVLVVTIITSCQKVINVNLNSASPAIVIVGNINDQPGPYTVTINQTVNFSQPNTFPAISGAFVTVTDNTGIIDTLTETLIPGVYNTKKTVGAQGRTYTLNVIANGQAYSSVSSMPQLVPFDTLLMYVHASLGFGKGGNNNDSIYVPEAIFQDPANVANYYRFIETINDTLISNVYSFDDEFSNGKGIIYRIRSEDHPIAVGETITIEMQCIDKGTYQYLSTLGEASGSTNVTPANPTSNISNNALGYFSAHTSRVRSVFVE